MHTFNYSYGCTIKKKVLGVWLLVTYIRVLLDHYNDNTHVIIYNRPAINNTMSLND